MLLSQGENYIITILPWLQFHQLGYYSIVFNLGSMIPHIIFSPVEESLYILCGRQLKETDDETKTEFFNHNFKGIQRILLYCGL
ncbi:hypothetical protein MXB_2411, partial [Myxobolus squamalis]